MKAITGHTEDGEPCIRVIINGLELVRVVHEDPYTPLEIHVLDKKLEIEEGEE